MFISILFIARNIEDASPLGADGYILRKAEPRHYAFAMAAMEESVLASVSEEEASHSEDWMDRYRNIVCMHFDGAGMMNDLYILEKDGLPAGVLWLGVGNDQFTGVETGYVLGIQVCREHRGSGLGMELLRWAECWCRRRGLTGMSINVSPSNVWAKRLYEEFGFQTHSLVMRCNVR